MEFGFRDPHRAYLSGSQLAKVWTEQWAADNMFCPNCGNSNIFQLPANAPVADFYCARCQDQFELKSKKSAFGPKLANGAYSAKCERLVSATNPNLILLQYSVTERKVRNVCVIPKHFFVLDIVQKRPPLSDSARRRGWVGSNILLSRVPDSGRIDIVRDGRALPIDQVLASWKQTLFLRGKNDSARGWLLEVMNCVDGIGRSEFELEDVYAFVPHLQVIFPNNNNVKPKIRQQLQVLRDNGYLEFTSRGKYRRPNLGGI